MEIKRVWFCDLTENWKNWIEHHGKAAESHKHQREFKCAACCNFEWKRNSLWTIILSFVKDQFVIVKCELEEQKMNLLKNLKYVSKYSHVPMNSTGKLNYLWRYFLLFLELNCYLLGCLITHLSKQALTIVHFKVSLSPGACNVLVKNPPWMLNTTLYY